MTTLPGVDPCFAALVTDPRTALRPPGATMAIARYRSMLDATMAGAAGPAMAAVRDLSIAAGGQEVPVRLYRPDASDTPLPLILFGHGGGFVIGSIATHDALCRMLAAKTGMAVASVGYRLAPETPFPGAIEDVEAVLRALVAQAAGFGLDAGRIALCGDSAGGNIIAAVAYRGRDAGPRIGHLGLLYPVVDPGCDSASMRAMAAGPVLTQAVMRWFWDQYLGGAAASSQAALLDADAAGLPPTTISTAGRDPLCDEGEALAQHLRACGVAVIARRYPGMVHGFASMADLTPMAGRAIADLARDIRESLA